MNGERLNPLRQHLPAGPLFPLFTSKYTGGSVTSVIRDYLTSEEMKGGNTWKRKN